MSRGGNKIVASVWICSECKKQTDRATMINKATNPKLELKGYCKRCRKHTLQGTKAEKKGSLGLARNK